MHVTELETPTFVIRCLFYRPRQWNDNGKPQQIIKTNNDRTDIRITFVII